MRTLESCKFLILYCKFNLFRDMLYNPSTTFKVFLLLGDSMTNQEMLARTELGLVSMNHIYPCLECYRFLQRRSTVHVTTCSYLSSNQNASGSGCARGIASSCSS